LISWAVVGHESRRIHATDLVHSLDAVASMDDGTLGADDNHLRAWSRVDHPRATHFGVMEDDAILAPRFAEQVDAALAVAPTPIVSLYLGRSKPKRFQDRISRALVAAGEQGACWVTGTHMLHAVAIVMRAELRDDWLEWANTSTLPIDERMGMWCRNRGHSIGYAWPSLVNHRDLPTLVQHRDGKTRTEPRVAWRTGTRERWTDWAVEL